MTQKHQLKTIPCITYYFMLGWNLSACINSLYKLRLAASGQPPCWGISLEVFVDGVRGSGGGGTREPQFLCRTMKMMMMMMMMKQQKKQSLICDLQSLFLFCFVFLCGWVGLVGG